MTQELDAERRKLHFRSCHRGIKEMDIIFGKFADTVLADLPQDDLADYQRILELPDDKLFSWATGREDVPDDVRSPLLDRLLSLGAASILHEPSPWLSLLGTNRADVLLWCSMQEQRFRLGGKESKQVRCL